MSSRNCAIVISRGHTAQRSRSVALMLRVYATLCVYVQSIPSVCKDAPPIVPCPFVCIWPVKRLRCNARTAQKPVTKRPKEVANPQLFFFWPWKGRQGSCISYPLGKQFVEFLPTGWSLRCLAGRIFSLTLPSSCLLTPHPRMMISWVFRGNRGLSR